MTCKCECKNQMYEKLTNFIVKLHNEFGDEILKPTYLNERDEEVFVKRLVTQEILDYIDLLDKEGEYGR